MEFDLDDDEFEIWTLTNKGQRVVKAMGWARIRVDVDGDYVVKDIDLYSSGFKHWICSMTGPEFSATKAHLESSVRFAGRITTQMLDTRADADGI
jgi:hypothetical protein